MTTAPPSSPSTRDDDLDASPETAQEPAVPGRRPARSPWWRLGYPVVLGLLVLAIPALVFVGLRVILDSTDGQLVRRVSDPAAPGFEAVVEPTPTQLVASTGPDGGLDSLTVLAQTSEGIGGVLTVPATTLVPLGVGPVPLSSIYENNGPDALRETVGGLLDLDLADLQVVTSADWATYVGPVAPLTFDNPDPVVDEAGAVAFPRGTLELAADQVWPYLSGRGAGESDLSRMVRIQAFWEAWLAEIGGAGAGALPSPAESGLGVFLAALADDQVQYLTLPVSPDDSNPGGIEQFVVDGEAARSAVAAVIPFPQGVPGTRPRLRVLDGTGQLDHGVAAAIALAAAGGQVDVVGNARTFGATTTQFVYYDPAREADARRMRDALGVGEVVQSDQTNSATDLTVVLGDDYLAVVGAEPAAAAQPETMDVDGG